MNQSAADRKVWEMATDDPVWIGRMEKLGIAPDRTRGATHFYTIPDNQITVRRKVVRSEESKRAAAERLRAARLAKLNAG